MPMIREHAEQIAYDYLREESIDTIGRDTFDTFVSNIQRHVGGSVSTSDVARIIGIRSHSGRVASVSISREGEERAESNWSWGNLFEGVISSVSDIEDQEEPIHNYEYGANRVESTRNRKRSEREMMMDIVGSEGFPRPDFTDWSSMRELRMTLDDWYSNVEHKENWIFTRREREGFNRRNIGQLHLDDIMSRIGKRRGAHKLDTDKSKFYDWKLGGTKWILRLELFQEGEAHFLISRYIHKPTMKEVKYDIRYWCNERSQFKYIAGMFSEETNNDLLFEEHVLSSGGQESPFEGYYGEEEFEVDEDEDY